ncbi:IS701 family transposase [Streptomyces radiopugnans]|uniref:SRSO17 transposase n=1 Tax=Streptomyces radiopugnans TaxID=403935 RepID=A0A1H9DZB3_9ACTN|nr:SRSO17 transposase [Streptomyces radiopugnans]
MSSSGVPTTVSDGGSRTQEFLEEVFEPLHRAEQRRWARAYLQGLIHASGRKTPRGMARTELMPPATAHGLHQFINASPWDWEPVRRRLALWVAANTTPRAWVVAELTIPKRGVHSVGVHRRLNAATGRFINCQQAVGLFLSADAHCFPVGWSLVLDDAWDRDRQRRRRARIPEAETARPMSSYIFDHAAAVAAQPRLPRVPWVLDLARCEDAGGLLAGLARHRFDVVCEVGPAQPVLAGHHASSVTTAGRLLEMRRTRRPYTAERQAAGSLPRTAPIRAYAGTVRLPRHDTDREGGSQRYRLLELRDPDGRQPARYWITSLTDRCVEETMALVCSRAAVRTAVTTLREQFGALDFAGRSFPGWHHHMTMVSAAYVHQHLHGAARSLAMSPVPHAAPTRAAG